MIPTYELFLYGYDATAPGPEPRPLPLWLKLTSGGIAAIVATLAAVIG